jgi:hypothetical protein
MSVKPVAIDEDELIIYEPEAIDEYERMINTMIKGLASVILKAEEVSDENKGLIMNKAVSALTSIYISPLNESR